MLTYIQGWILLQAMMAIAAWRFCGGWLGAFMILAGSFLYTVWEVL
jgi:hypothetical protein